MGSGSAAAVRVVESSAQWHRVWVVSELYYPEQTSTGHYISQIAEGLATQFDTHVICSQPTYSARGHLAPRREFRNGVKVRRIAATTLDKDVLLFRLVNAFTISFAVFVTALTGFRRGDTVLVVTNPPLLPFVVRLASFLRGVDCVLLIHDMYPEVLAASGLVRRGGVAETMIGFLTRWLYASMHAIVVIGRDMERRVRARLGDRSVQIAFIPNWADTCEITPLDRQRNAVLDELGIADRFVVQYSGNMGRSHGLEDLLDAATRLRDNAAVHFLFVGSGAKSAWLVSEARRRELANVTVQTTYPRGRLAELLAACDIATVAFQPGMAGVSVPSRIYNIMAAARPLLAVVDDDSDVATIVGRHGVGWVVAAGDVDGIVKTLVEASQDAEECRRRGARGRHYAETACGFGQVRSAYVQLLQGMMNARSRRDRKDMK